MAEDSQHLQAQLSELITRATAKDAIKDFSAAADLYSQATELQARLNGEMSVDNADLLFFYGKSLFNVAVSKSDVLGSKISGSRPTESKTSDEDVNLAGSISVKNDSIETINDTRTTKEDLDKETSRIGTAKNERYFQFTGDENFADSDSDEENEEDHVQSDEDDDDFSNAFEVLDLARILLLRKLDDIENTNDSPQLFDTSVKVKQIKERVADVYDLQAEISLEGERFVDAVADLKSSLELKESLLPLEDPSVAECHYKLSLALEFSAVDRRKGEDDSAHDGQIASYELRREAAKHMEIAIESCKAKIAQEQQTLQNGEMTDEDKMAATKRRIVNVKEIVSDMEQRVRLFFDEHLPKF
jgi:HAT1-interacting factor 1